MSAKYIVGALVGSLGVAYVCDTIVSDKKIFGGECHLTEDTCRIACAEVVSLYLKLLLHFGNRHRLQDCHRQGVESGHRRQVPGLASHCWTAGHQIGRAHV